MYVYTKNYMYKHHKRGIVRSIHTLYSTQKETHRYEPPFGRNVLINTFHEGHRVVKTSQEFTKYIK